MIRLCRSDDGFKTGVDVVGINPTHPSAAWTSIKAACINVCPQKIIRVGKAGNAKGYKFAEQFDADKCTGCKICAVICPEAAIEVYK